MIKPPMGTYRRLHRDNGLLRYAHAKLDGHLVQVTRADDGRVTAVTSLGTDITEKLPERLLANVHRHVPVGTVLLGELYVEGSRASDVKTALNDGREQLKISYFAVPTMRHDLELEAVDDAVTRAGLTFAPYERLRGDDVDHVDVVLSKYAELGYEGVVLKRGNVSHWRKAKVERTCDLVVTGYVDGEGKHLAMIGSLRCSVIKGSEMIEVANVSGMTDDQRVNMTFDWDDPERTVLGRVVEVRYQYLGSGGRLRHPRFMRVRDDKSPSECDGSDIYGT